MPIEGLPIEGGSRETVMPIRVLVVDDHALIRMALIDLLSAAPDIQVAGECSDGSQVAGAVATTSPDVVLMDLQMPYVDGLEAARELRARAPGVRVVILSGGLTAARAREAKAAGVAGFLLKDGDPDELADQVRGVAAGGTAWHSFAEVLAEAAPAGRTDDGSRLPAGRSPQRLEGQPPRRRA